jgi:hypothetical protein
MKRSSFSGRVGALRRPGRRSATSLPVSKAEKVCTGRDLARALAKTKLSEAEAKAWRRDLKKARKTLIR